MSMHWTPHSSLGAATIAFYAPALLASITLLYIHGPPRMAWLFLTLMCCIRMASGVFVILYQSDKHYQHDLSTSTSILLAVGIFPLLFALDGWFYILDGIDPHHGRVWLHWTLVVDRVVGVAALVILIAGSVLLGPLDDTGDGSRIGAALVRAGAVLVVGILSACVGIIITLWTGSMRRKLRAELLLVILAMLSLSAVLLVLRAVYMCIGIFDGGSRSIWNPLDGLLDPLVRMSLLPEYAVVVLMMVTGFWMRNYKKQGKAAADVVDLDCQGCP